MRGQLSLIGRRKEALEDNKYDKGRRIIKKYGLYALHFFSCLIQSFFSLNDLLKLENYSRRFFKELSRKSPEQNVFPTSPFCRKYDDFSVTGLFLCIFVESL